MADSKITQLSLSPYALDKDLVVVVTGHLEEGASPRNVKMPLSYIRRYVVRLNLLTSPQSGISTYYNSGLNILTLQHTPITGNLMRYDYAEDLPHDQTISTTGLNAIVGNNIDISFAGNGNASVGMRTRDGAWPTGHSHTHMGDPYHSGIISTTGLNATDENLMRIDFQSAWPHSGLISQTGLNIIRGNLVDIQFNNTSDAATAMDNRSGNWYSEFDKGNHLGEKYHSGILSVTGLNAYSGGPWGNLMRVDIDESRWPHSGIISQTGLNAIRGNLIDIQFDNTSEAATAMHSRNASWLNTFNKNKHLGKSYNSGIISITGVNARTENLLVKEYENTWPYTGVYYNTGLNAKAGNHIEIMHRTDSDANFFYPNIMGGKYQSGVISVTGLNVIQTTGHLITNYVQQDWPHRNVIHTTGLNLTTTTGNLTYSHAEPDWPHAHVVHTTGLNLSQATGHLIQQYQEPSWPYRNVVHSTGVNLRPDSDSNLSITRDASWPHSGVITQSGNRLYAANNSSNSDFPKTQGANNGLGFTFDRTSGGKGAVALFNMNKNKHTSTTQTINHGGSGVNYTVAGTFDSNKTLTVTTSHINDDKCFISYNNSYLNSWDADYELLTEIGLRLPDNLIVVKVPPIQGSGSTSPMKEGELQAVKNSTVTLGGVTDNGWTSSPSDWFMEGPTTLNTASEPPEIQISISGNSVTLLDAEPITFRVNETGVNLKGSYTVTENDPGHTVTYGTGYPGFVNEIYRTSSFGESLHPLSSDQNLDHYNSGEIHDTYDPNTNEYTLNAIKPMILKALVNPNVSSSFHTASASVALKYSLKNTRYVRKWKKCLGPATANADGYSIGEIVYRTYTANMPADIQCSISKPRYIRTETTEIAPTITIHTHPQDYTATSTTAEFTCVASLSDFIEPKLIWEKAESTSPTVFTSIGTATVTFDNDTGRFTSTKSLTGLSNSNDDGDKYRVKVQAWDGSFVNSNIATLSVDPPTLSFTQHPSHPSLTSLGAAPICDDGTASFSVVATSNQPGTTINYQWEVSTNGGVSYSDIGSATSATLNLTGLTASDDGNLYRCKISSAGFPDVTSNAGQLYDITITIDTQPTNQTSTRGTAAFTIAASQTGGSPFTLVYRFERQTKGVGSFNNVQTSTSTTLNRTGLTYSGNEGDKYRVKVRLQSLNDCVEVTSSEVTLTVREIEITLQPDTQEITGTNEGTVIPVTGGNLVLRSTAVGYNLPGSIHYQWQTSSNGSTSWSDIASETNQDLVLSRLEENSGKKYYRVRVDDDTSANDPDDDNGVIRQTSNVCNVTTSTFIAKGANVDDNIGFKTVERDGTGTLSETMFIQFCYNLNTKYTSTETGDNLTTEAEGIGGQNRIIEEIIGPVGVGYNISVDANTNEQAGINVSGTHLGTNYTTATDIARILATHPDTALSTASIGQGPVFFAGDIINVEVTGQVNQYIARVNVPE
jgi:hypothetical protein